MEFDCCRVILGHLVCEECPALSIPVTGVSDADGEKTAFLHIPFVQVKNYHELAKYIPHPIWLGLGYGDTTEFFRRSRWRLRIGEKDMKIDIAEAVHADGGKQATDGYGWVIAYTLAA